MNIVRWVLALILGSTQLTSQARELTIAFGIDRPPYVFGREGRGLEIDVARAALATKGHTLKVVSRSNARMLADLAHGYVDGAATVEPSVDGAFLSDPFITFENYAISLKASRLAIRRVADLKAYSVAAWQGAHRTLGPEFETLFNPSVRAPYIQRYHEVENQRSQNHMFWKGRVQVILVDRAIFSWFRQELSSSIDTTPEVEFHNILAKGASQRIAFSDKALRDDFNEGLAQIRKSGLYKRLYENYTSGTNTAESPPDTP